MKKALLALAVLALAACAIGLPVDVACRLEQMALTCRVVDAGVPVPDAGPDAPSVSGVPEASTEAGPEAEAGSDAKESGLGSDAADAREASSDARDSGPDADAAPMPFEAGRAQRPAGNAGTGFFVVGSKVYDANGVEFRMRGFNHLHWDAPGVGIYKTGANAERWVIDFGQSAATNAGLMQRSIANGVVPIPGSWDGTCDSTPAVLSSIVDTWVAQASRWKPFERQMILNVANEWGPGDTPLGQPQGAGQAAWRDSYSTAVQRIRAAGLNAAVLVDSGGCGQAPGDLVDFAQAVEAADPQHNVLFGVHVYGQWCSSGCQSWQQPLPSGFDALRAVGLPIVVGEFGPGYGLNASTDVVPPRDVMLAAEARGFGWLAWAWDDPAGEFSPGICPPNDHVYSLSCTGDYRSSADLTTFGRLVVEDPSLGTKFLARKATVFP